MRVSLTNGTALNSESSRVLPLEIVAAKLSPTFKLATGVLEIFRPWICDEVSSRSPIPNSYRRGPDRWVLRRRHLPLPRRNIGRVRKKNNCSTATEPAYNLILVLKGLTIYDGHSNEPTPVMLASVVALGLNPANFRGKGRLPAVQADG